MMRNKKAFFLHGIILAVFCALFFSSTSIVLFFGSKSASFKKGNLENFPAKDAVFFLLNPLSASEDILESIELTGWAFCRTSSDNSNKNISLLLVSSSDVYYTTISPINRIDLAISLNESYGDVYGANHLLSYPISTLSVPPGVYDVYLYVWENESNYGLINTKQKYVKDHKRFYQYMPQIISSVDSVESPDIKCSLNTKSDEVSVKFWGWAIQEETDAQTQDVILEFFTESGEKITYETTKQPRYDVGLSFHNDLYNLSGFELTLPFSELPNNIHEIRVVLIGDKNLRYARNFPFSLNK